MKRNILLGLALFLCTTNALLIFTQSSQAQGGGFGSVVPFMGGSGRMGFFDQSTGTVYIYNDNLSTCLYIGQGSELGQPFQQLKNAPVKYQGDVPDVQELKEEIQRERSR